VTLGGRESEELVDPAVEGEGPAAVENATFDGDFKGGGGAVRGGGLGAELLVPIGPELRAPEPGLAAGGIPGAEGEIGKLADAQAGGAGVEGEFHGQGTEYGERPDGKRKRRKPHARVRERRARSANAPKITQTAKAETIPATTS